MTNKYGVLMEQLAQLYEHCEAHAPYYDDAKLFIGEYIVNGAQEDYDIEVDFDDEGDLLEEMLRRILANE